jgi:hypothetical protein
MSLLAHLSSKAAWESTQPAFFFSGLTHHRKQQR